MTPGSSIWSGRGACLPGSAVIRSSSEPRRSVCECQVPSPTEFRTPCRRSLRALPGSVTIGMSLSSRVAATRSKWSPWWCESTTASRSGRSSIPTAGSVTRPGGPAQAQVGALPGVEEVGVGQDGEAAAAKQRGRRTDEGHFEVAGPRRVAWVRAEWTVHGRPPGGSVPAGAYPPASPAHQETALVPIHDGPRTQRTAPPAGDRPRRPAPRPHRPACSRSTSRRRPLHQRGSHHDGPGGGCAGRSRTPRRRRGRRPRP